LRLYRRVVAHYPPPKCRRPVIAQIVTVISRRNRAITSAQTHS
jgi:hypothetical protein